MAEIGYAGGVRLLWVSVILGCSANGGSVESSQPDAQDAAAIDGSTEDSGSSSDGSIFPTEDTDTTDTAMADDATLADSTDDSVVADACDCTEIAVNVTDCGSVTCPLDYPYPIGCSITMAGSDSRGCVVHAAGSSKITFQVGSSCSGTADGFVTGTVTCSKTPGGALNGKNCPISKPLRYYVSTLSSCP
jgi:hypothetical protein